MDEVKSWLISISLTAMAICMPFAIALAKSWLQKHLSEAQFARVSQVADKAGDLAYLVLARQGASIHDPAALNTAIAIGQQYMKQQAPTAIAATGKTDDDLAKMVEARVGGAAKVDSGVTIGIQPSAAASTPQPLPAV